MITTINLHPTEDARAVATRSGDFIWITMGDDVHLHVPGETFLGELAGAIDQASHLLAGDL